MIALQVLHQDVNVETLMFSEGTSSGSSSMMLVRHASTMNILLANHGAELPASQVTCLAASSAPWLGEAGLAQPDVCELCVLHYSCQTSAWACQESGKKQCATQVQCIRFQGER